MSSVATVSTCDRTDRGLSCQGAAISEGSARHRERIELAEAAGRAAYLTAYHAAQAFIFARTDKIAKTHSGVRSEFARLAKDDPRIDRALPTFLAQAYNLKSIADYAIGSNVGISLAEAEEAISKAARFLDRISSLIAEQPPTKT
jgi:uncharacterized protein (UPF0332 family)